MSEHCLINDLRVLIHLPTFIIDYARALSRAVILCTCIQAVVLIVLDPPCMGWIRPFSLTTVTTWWSMAHSGSSSVRMQRVVVMHNEEYCLTEVFVHPKLAVSLFDDP